LPDEAAGGGRVLGVDLGEVRVGLALSDPTGVVANAFDTLDVRRAPDAGAVARAIVEAAREYDVTTVVIGLPRALSGREGRPAQHAREVARLVEELAGMDVELWDERFTTVEAERALIDGGTRRRERRTVVDRVAATLLLQTYLDARRRGAGRGGTGGGVG
jgi:putative holliday junction resolvase